MTDKADAANVSIPRHSSHWESVPPNLPDQVRSAANQVYEDSRRGFSGANIRRPPGSGTDFTSWRGNLLRVLRSKEFQEAAGKFDKAHKPGETFWRELLDQAADIPCRYVLGDRRTNGQKAEFVEEVLAAARHLWTLIERDLVVSAVDGEVGAPPSLVDGAAMPGHVLFEIRSCPVGMTLARSRGRGRRKHKPRDYSRYVLTMGQVGLIVEATLKPLEAAGKQLRGEPDEIQFRKGRALLRFAIRELQPVFKRAFPCSLKGQNRLIAAITNAAFELPEEDGVDGMQVTEIRYYLNEAQGGSRANNPAPGNGASRGNRKA